MKIIQIDGSDYLDTGVIKLDDNHIDANMLFLDCYEFTKKYKPTKEYGNNISAFLRKYNCTYFSPSLMTSYMANPTLSIVSNFFYEDKNAPTRIGTDFHAILEDYYKQNKELRDRAQLKKKLETIENKKLHEYLSKFIKSQDFNNVDDKELTCKTEVRFKQQLHPKGLHALPIKTSGIIDRVDFRNDGIYVIDYKTGTPKPNAVSFDGYLGSMILYKWAAEQLYNEQVISGYLMAPMKSNPWLELDFSRANELEMYDRVNQFYEKIKEDRKTNIFEFTNKGFLYSPDARNLVEAMKTGEKYQKIGIKAYLGESKC